MKAIQAALVLALALAGCGSSSSGKRTDPGRDPGTDPGTHANTGTCTVAGAATATVPVTVFCTNTGANRVWSLGLLDMREPVGQLPTVGGVYFFGADTPQLHHDYALTDAYVSDYYPYLAFITADGRWAAGDSRFSDLTRGSVRVNLTAIDGVTAHGTVAATLKSDASAADVQMTCTF